MRLRTQIVSWRRAPNVRKWNGLDSHSLLASPDGRFGQDGDTDAFLDHLTHQVGPVEADAELEPATGAETWWHIVGPAGMPADIVQALKAEINKILASPELVTFLNNEGAEAEPMDPQQFADMIRREIARWTKVAREVPISIDCVRATRLSASTAVQADIRHA